MKIVVELKRTLYLKLSEMQEAEVFFGGSILAVSSIEAAELTRKGQVVVVSVSANLPMAALGLPAETSSLVAGLNLASAGFCVRPAVRGGFGGWHLPKIPGSYSQRVTSGFTKERPEIVRLWRVSEQCWPAFIQHHSDFNQVWLWRHGAISHIPLEVIAR